MAISRERMKDRKVKWNPIRAMANEISFFGSYNVLNIYGYTLAIIMVWYKLQYPWCAQELIWFNQVLWLWYGSTAFLQYSWTLEGWYWPLAVCLKPRKWDDHLRGRDISAQSRKSKFTWFLICWLVVWNIFYFPYIGNNNPNWLSYFSEGLKPATSMVCLIDARK